MTDYVMRDDKKTQIEGEIGYTFSYNLWNLLKETRSAEDLATRGDEDIFVLVEVDEEINDIQSWCSEVQTVYKLHVDTTAPSISSKKHLLNYDDKITLAQIKARYKAFDDHEGDITNRIKFETDYPENYEDVVIKTYTITASVSDDSGNRATVTNSIQVFDITKPLFSGTTSHNIYFGETITMDDIFNSLSCVDNFDKNISKEKWKVDGNKQIDLRDLTPQHFTIYTLDTSNNRGEIGVILQITDNKAPVITVLDVVEVSTTNPLTQEELINLLTQSGQIPTNYQSIELESTYFNNQTEVQTHNTLCTITLEDGTKEYYRFEINVSNTVTEAKDNNNNMLIITLSSTLGVVLVVGSIIVFVIVKRRKNAKQNS